MSLEMKQIATVTVLVVSVGATYVISKIHARKEETKRKLREEDMQRDLDTMLDSLPDLHAHFKNNLEKRQNSGNDISTEK